MAGDDMLVIYQDWHGWFENDYEKFEFWFKRMSAAYHLDNEYQVLALGKDTAQFTPEPNLTVNTYSSSPKRQFFDLVTLRSAIRRELREDPPDVIFSPYIYLLSAVPADTEVPVVGFLRDRTADMVESKGGWRRLAGYAFRRLDKQAMKRIDLLLHNGFHLVEYAESLGYAGQRRYTPRPILDADRFDRIEAGDATPATLEGGQIVLTVARLTHEKGIDIGIKAMPYLPEDVHLHIVGAGSEHSHLRRLVELYDHTHRVHFHGFVEHERIWEYYAAADVFWLLSRSNFEGTPNALQEAWYSRTPSIVSPIDALASIVQDHHTGIILDFLKSSMLATETMSLLHNNDLAEHIGARGKEKIEEILTHHEPTHRIVDKMLQK
jgi:glycosyltransferase involved in cell wall biosynthesis